MGLFDKVKSALHGKGDQAAGAIDKAADMIDDKTGSKHSKKIDSVADKAKEAVDKLDDSAEQ